ncbi:MAG: TetR/AcrR family transcriptional regulator [Pseudomonadota bacterium]
MATRFPKREQRKQASRTALINAAIELLREHGFEDTRLEAVAERAGLHVQTLYRHFACKRELVTAVDQHYLDRFQAACAARTEDTMHFWRAWMRKSTRNMVTAGRRYTQSVNDIYAVPNFPTPYLRIWHEYEQTLARALAEDLQCDDQDPLPILIACMLWGGTTHVYRRWLQDPKGCDLEGETLALIDRVIEQHGMATTRSHTVALKRN